MKHTEYGGNKHYLPSQIGETLKLFFCCCFYQIFVDKLILPGCKTVAAWQCYVVRQSKCFLHIYYPERNVTSISPDTMF